MYLRRIINLSLILTLLSLSTACSIRPPTASLQDPRHEELREVLQRQSEALLQEDLTLLSTTIHPLGVFVRVEFKHSNTKSETYYTHEQYLLTAEDLWERTEHLKAESTGFRVKLLGEDYAVVEAFTLLEYRENSTGTVYRNSARVEYSLILLTGEWVIREMLMREYTLEPVGIS